MISKKFYCFSKYHHNIRHLIKHGVFSLLSSPNISVKIILFCGIGAVVKLFGIKEFKSGSSKLFCKGVGARGSVLFFCSVDVVIDLETCTNKLT